MTSTERPQDGDGERNGWRRSPFAVVSVAAAVLLAGGGGAYFATTSSDGGGDGKSAARGAGDLDPPPLTLGAEAGGGAGTDPGLGIAPGEPSPYGVEYRASGTLPEGPDSAAVHRPEGSVAAADVARLAKALGVSGAPERSGTAWKVGGHKDGSGPLLTVEEQAPGDWTFGRFGPAPGGDDCLKGKECPSGDGGGSNPVVPGDGAGPVSERAAKKAAAPVLKALGQEDAALDAGQLMGAVRVVNAAPVVAGLPTYGWSTGIQIGADGQVVAGSGKLKEPAKGAEYPVVGAAEALKLLNGAAGDRGTSGIGGCASAVPQKDGREPAAPCEPEGKGVKPTQVPVGKAVFGLASRQVEGRAALVPSWWFEVAGAGDGPASFVTRTAVLPEYLTRGGGSGDGTDAGTGNDDGAVRQDSDEPGSPVETYSADGSTLSVRFTGGVCGEYSVRAEESGSVVKVEVVDSAPPGGVCIAMAKAFTEKVTLDKPLGDRKVVDAVTGDAVPLRK
ncbi:hypothetical protein [Streptomyces sp. IB2014 016-6]|uniref:hypothetical protein n=1 Tax=Streptomyces sp. IB2014 016-6 TaxID=2517818 RepID=UPI0011CC503E|nr:hypothetical protein [Streptomyces sp. IB2014 016-6]TXL92730.1 hypothetical protein EW053_01800 [Streptomyces sp. IB2014 016-6]